MTLYYLAHPYSNDPVRNIERCKVIAAQLFVKGYKFYAPILMTHPIHETAHMLGLYEGEYWEEWMAFDQEILVKCAGLILCPGWEDSKGCKQERLYFLYNKKPILLLEEILKKEPFGFTECIICKKLFPDSATKGRNITNMMDYCPACYTEKVNSWE